MGERGIGTASRSARPPGRSAPCCRRSRNRRARSAKLSTWVRSLRSTKSISGSPAISSAKRVQRAHWMQRSRSSNTSSLNRIGFSQCRFSSTKRDSPGPNASVWSCSGHSPPRSHTGQSSGWLMRRNSRTPSWIFFTVSDCGVADHAVGDGRGARGRIAAHPLDLDEAHAAHADRLHALVPAEARDVRRRAPARP